MDKAMLVIEPLAILVLAVAVAVAGVVLVRRSQRFERHFHENEVAGLLFSALGVVVIGFSFFLRQDSLRGQALMTGVSAGTLACVPLLIYGLNSPLTGPMPVSKQPFEHALQQFHAIDLVQ